VANLSKNNHFLSQMYLNAWKNENGKLLVHDFLVPNVNYPMWQEKATRGVGSYDSMYIRYKDGNYIDDFEKWFNDYFETPSYESLEKARNGIDLNEEDYNKLVKLVTCHYLRSPKFIFKILDVARREGDKVMNNEMKKIENELSSSNKRLSFDHSSDSCIPFDFEVSGEYVKITAILGKGFYLEMVRFLFPKIYNSFSKYSWKVFDIDERVTLPTSDNPVNIFSYYGIHHINYDVLLEKPNSFIAFPLSPNKVLLGHYNLDLIDEDSIGYGLSLLLKKIIVDNAYKRVISNNEDKDVLLIRDRVVDEQKFLSEIKMWKDMHEQYTTEEVSYLKKKKAFNK
jgi:hypothetical protein